MPIVGCCSWCIWCVRCSGSSDYDSSVLHTSGCMCLFIHIELRCTVNHTSNSVHTFTMYQCIVDKRNSFHVTLHVSPPSINIDLASNQNQLLHYIKRKTLYVLVVAMFMQKHHKVMLPMSTTHTYSYTNVDASWIWWHTVTHGRGSEGKLSNGVGSRYSSHYLGTSCIQHYYSCFAHLGCQ